MLGGGGEGRGRGSSLRKKMTTATMMKKRKDVEDVSDDFSDFSLSSPARKIRRLDAELPPIMEEEEEEEEGGGGEKVREVEIVERGIGPCSDANKKKEQQQQPHKGLVIEEMDDSGNQNQERAIVLFRPVNSYLPHQYSSGLSSYSSVSLDPHTIPGFKNQLIWPSQSYSHVKSMEGEGGGGGAVSTDRMAIIPWISSQLPAAQGMDTSQTEAASELMEAEEIGEAAMDVEDSNSNNSGSMAPGHTYGLPQWQQQHCLIPQLPPAASSSPITWFQ